jgi:hypothetical protein
VTSVYFLVRLRPSRNLALGSGFPGAVRCRFGHGARSRLPSTTPIFGSDVPRNCVRRLRGDVLSCRRPGAAAVAPVENLTRLTFSGNRALLSHSGGSANGQWAELPGQAGRWCLRR